MSILALLRELLRALSDAFRSRDICDHAFIAESARKAIGAPDDPTDLMLALDYRIRHILVDEFQDTSISQKRLLDTLTAGWSEGDGRTIFLVGDPMQSIYKFREADVSLFIQLKARGFDSVRLHHLRLTRNFRSQAPLVDWFNAAFPGVFPAQDDVTTGAVAYQPTEPTRPSAVTPPVRLIPCPAGDARIEADTLIRVIADIRAMPDPDATAGGKWNPVIAVLFRSRSHVAEIVRSLNQCGITYQAVDVDALTNRQEVLDLVALTRACSIRGSTVVARRPACPVVRTGVVRPPRIDALDAVTPLPVLLRQEQRRAAMSPDGELRLRRAVPVLDRWSSSVGASRSAGSSNAHGRNLAVPRRWATRRCATPPAISISLRSSTTAERSRRSRNWRIVSPACTPSLIPPVIRGSS